VRLREKPLENEIARAQAAEAAMLALESLRETAARLYLHETGHSWRPAGGSGANHGGYAEHPTKRHTWKAGYPVNGRLLKRRS
jgi:hypothetical protein